MILGFVSWIYASTLAYIVDSNTGRSGTAIACNSIFRGAGAFIAIEIAVPLQVSRWPRYPCVFSSDGWDGMQDSLGDGWLYTIWGILLAVSSALLILVMIYGRRWREGVNGK